MMKKTCFLFTLILLLIAFVGCSNGDVTPSNNHENSNSSGDPSQSDNSQFVEYGVAGNIIELTTNENGSSLGTIRVEGTEDNGAEYTEAVVTITPDTKIYSDDLTDFESLEVGMYVDVFFEGDVAESFPVQATAKQINIIPDETNQDTQNLDENSDKNSDDISDDPQDSDRYPEVNRPDTKEITTFPEGMEEVNTYHLVNENDLPFTTYIRENFEYTLLNTKYGHGVSISPQESDMLNIDIVFFDEGTSEDEALSYVRSELENIADVQERPRGEDDQLEEWVIASFVHVVHGAKEYGELSVGEYNGSYFYFYGHYAPEAGDGYYPFQQVIKDEWQWKETNEPLVGSAK